jgi:hypothetical protein
MALLGTITETLEAWRNRNFSAVLYTEYTGDALPLDGATIKMEIRAYGGAAGSALAADTDVTFTDEATPSDDEPTLRTLTLEPFIAKATISGLPGQNEPEAGDAQRLVYEIMIFYADSERDSLWIGDFNVNPGVVAP